MNIQDKLFNVKKLGIAGHVRPDGDCVGSCMGLYNYICENFPQIETHVYMESTGDRFNYINNMDKVEEEVVDTDFDLFISVDVSDKERIGVAYDVFNATTNTLCIDHHISNDGFAKENIVVPLASSASEVVFDILDEEKISKDTAEALYTGIVHDSGVFKYSSTSRHTMEVAGKLIDKGFNFQSIIDDGFYSRSYIQNKILGRALLESIVFLDGKCIFSALSKENINFYGVTHQELGGIAEQLRLTRGVECAIFIYETNDFEYKVSLRSNNFIDCNEVAGYFGGGGHIRAAGCTMKGTTHDVINNLAEKIEIQFLRTEAN
ncbi:MAG: bifunctional oligoribonuclease/PAP phosphatase NrnA [Clostridiales bacterium]|nr:bifunctional oligoribonuclease/PAP phosphatase NrnA [Clostridiales bacterium]